MPKRVIKICQLCKKLFNHPLSQIASIGFAILCVYWGLWKCYFQFDDYWQVGWVRFSPDLLSGLMSHIDRGHSIKVFANLIPWLIARAWGINSTPFYIVALVQHFLVSILVYCLVSPLGFRKSIAWLSAILFATTFCASEAVNWISGSTYSLVSIMGLSAVLLFICYRVNGNFWYFGLSWFLMGLMLFTHEASFSYLAMCFLYDIFIAQEGQIKKALSKIIIPQLGYAFWAVPYILVRINILHKSAEYSGNLGIGFNVPINFRNLTFLIIPNFASPPITNFLNRYLPPTWLGIAGVSSWLIYALFLLTCFVILWKGKAKEKYLVCWIFAAYAPYSMWLDPYLSGASRYRYVPAIAFFILLASGLIEWWLRLERKQRVLACFAPAFVIGLLMVNLAYQQMWIRQQIYNGNVKRAVVNQLIQDYPSLPEDSGIVMELPELNFHDLCLAPNLIYSSTVNCQYYVTGSPPTEVKSGAQIRIRVNDRGFEKLVTIP